MAEASEQRTVFVKCIIVQALLAVCWAILPRREEASDISGRGHLRRAQSGWMKRRPDGNMQTMVGSVQMDWTSY